MAAPHVRAEAHKKEERFMARVAVVTGGTRGIGEAISVALRDAGFTVAANYAGNEEKAREFSERTGIKSYKWDVSDFDACIAGCQQIESELGPIDGRRGTR
jgi:acetoacetyl-CoA reductase